MSIACTPLHMRKLRTDSYVMTADPRCSASMLELQTIRNTVKAMNKKLRHFKYGTQEQKSGYGNQSYSQFYVKCQGRWGKNNPNYNQRTIPFCPLEFANEMDVYIYKR